MAKKPAKKKWGKPTKKAATKKTTKTKTMTAKPIKLPKKREASRPRNTQTLSYTFSEFVENVKDFCGLPKRSEAKEICEDIANFIKDSLRRGYKIPLLGLGKLYVRQSKARMGRNPQTGEMVHIPARKRVRFSAAKALKEAVL
ncbi:MAG: HU family DNA-binding protein [Proteobacteria bacterium]|nr:MAG: HU family DNA-binding protein [Pseudomonadota bacterium]